MTLIIGDKLISKCKPVLCVKQMNDFLAHDFSVALPGPRQIYLEFADLLEGEKSPILQKYLFYALKN